MSLTPPYTQPRAPSALPAPFLQEATWQLLVLGAQATKPDSFGISIIILEPVALQATDTMSLSPLGTSESGHG